MMEIDEEERFVEYVRDTPILWDTRSPKFRNKNAKIGAWQNIGSKFGLSGQQANGKWVSLREKYRREVTYWEEVSIYGTENPKHKWHLMDAMNFIDAVYKPRSKSVDLTIKRRKTENNGPHGSLFEAMLHEMPKDITISSEISHCSSPEPSSSPLQIQQQEFKLNCDSIQTVDNDIKHKKHYKPSTSNRPIENWDKQKYLSFGTYIGHELCSMNGTDAEELHEILMSSILEYKRSLREVKNNDLPS